LNKLNTVAIGKPEWHVHKASYCGSKQHRDYVPQSLYYCLLVPHIYGCYSSCTSRWWWIANLTQCQRRGCNNNPSFVQQTAPIAHSFCEVCTWHDHHILVTAPFCCDQKAWASCAQSFTLWQQVTIEIMHCNLSVISCLCHIYMGVILHAHPVRGELQIWHNANGEVATIQRSRKFCFKYSSFSECQNGHL